MMTERIKKHNISVGVTLFVMALFFVVTNSDSTSPLFPNSREIDSGIFQYMGYIITQGRIPYTEYFDHKGLLQYFIDALGLTISKQWGIFLLQVIHMTLVLCVWYKGIVMIKDARLRLFIILVALTVLYYCFGSGNLTEEWSLLFISYPLMLYYTKMGKVVGARIFSPRELLLMGMCIGCIMMLRFNNFFPMMGVPLYCAYVAAVERDYSYIFRGIVLMMIGCLFPIIICVAYMYVVGGMQGVEDMIFANWTFNVQYRETYHGWGFNVGMVKFFHRFLIPFLFVIFVCKRQKELSMPIVIGFILGLLTMGKTGFHHYLMVLVPLVVYSIGILKKKYCLILMFILLVTDLRFFYQEFSIDHYMQGEDNATEKIGEMIEKIPAEHKNKVWAQNMTMLLKDCIKNDFMPENRILLYFQIDKSEKLCETEKNKIIRLHPEYVLYSDWKIPGNEYVGYEEDELFIKENYSVLSASQLSNGTKLYLYKKR